MNKGATTSDDASSKLGLEQRQRIDIKRVYSIEELLLDNSSDTAASERHGHDGKRPPLGGAGSGAPPIVAAATHCSVTDIAATPTVIDADIRAGRRGRTRSYGSWRQAVAEGWAASLYTHATAAVSSCSARGGDGEPASGPRWGSQRPAPPPAYAQSHQQQHSTSRIQQQQAVAAATIGQHAHARTRATAWEGGCAPDARA